MKIIRWWQNQELTQEKKKKKSKYARKIPKAKNSNITLNNNLLLNKTFA